MPAPDAFAEDCNPNFPPISLGLRLLDATLQTLEWIGPPGQESCLACGAGRKLGHVAGCSVARALEPGTGVDALDGAIGVGVFLTASQRYSLVGQVRMMARKLIRMEAMVTRVLDLLPRA